MSRLRPRGPQPVQPQSINAWHSNPGSQVSNPTNPTLATSAVASSTAPEPTATLEVQTHNGTIIAKWPVSQTKYVHRQNGNYPDGISHLETQAGGQPTLLHHCSLAISHNIYTTNIPPGWEAYDTIVGIAWVIGIQPMASTYPPPL